MIQIIGKEIGLNFQKQNKKSEMITKRKLSFSIYLFKL